MIASNWFCVRLLSGVRLTLPGPSATRRVTSRLKRRRLSGVAVLRHRQAIDILVTLENLDPKDLVVKTMSPSPVIVDSKSTNDRLAAGLADICAMRYLRRLCSTSLTLVVGNEELFSACAIARNRLLEMFRSLAHIALYVGTAPKCEVNAAFWRAGLSRDRCQSGRFQFVTVARDVVSPVLMVIPDVVAVAHELQVVWTTVTRREVLVMDDRALPGERWNLSQQSLAGHDPMDCLPGIGRWMFNNAIATTLVPVVKRHEGGGR